jgi:hypothetical protein
MRKAKYTDEQIIEAGKLLQKEEKEVTANAIKLRLGGGKAARIGEVWNAYLDAHDPANPQESRLNTPIDPDNKFAFEIEDPIKGAARKVEGVFETLLDRISHDAESRMEELLAREEVRHRGEEAFISGQLRNAERDVERKEKERYEMLQKLIAAEKKIESLEATIKSMSKQIKEFKERDSI